MVNSDNLIPLNKRTKEMQRKIQSLGGKTRAENVRKTKQLIKISEYLHEFIDSQKEDVRVALKKIVSKGGQPLLNLIKEVRESTEGNKLNASITTRQELPEGLTKEDLLKYAKWHEGK